MRTTKRRQFLVLVTVAALAASALTACSSDEGTGETTTTTATTTPAETTITTPTTTHPPAPASTTTAGSDSGSTGGATPPSPEDLKGGDAEYNAKELVRVFTGDDKGPHRDALLMGTSLVLEVQGRASDAQDGVSQAAAAIDDGRAEAFLGVMREHFSNR